MKILILTTLALLIISCDEDNLVRDERVNEKREGWVVIDSILERDNLYPEKLTFYPVNIFRANSDTLYLRMVSGVSDDQGKIYKKIISKEPEYISDLFPNLRVFKENTFISGYDYSIISNDFGKTKVRYDSLISFDFIEKNDELYLLTQYHGIIKMSKDLKTFSIIDSSIFKNNVFNQRYNHYLYFHIFNNNDCILFNFEENEILYISENFTKKEIISSSDNILNEFNDIYMFFYKSLISVESNNLIYCRTKNGLYKSTNKGKTWSLILEKKYTSWSKLLTINENIIYLLDFDYNKSTLYVSLDGGNSFELQETPTGIIFYDIYFENSNVGYAIGNNGEILKTISAGFKD